MSAASHYTTRISKEEYMNSSTIGLKVYYLGGDNIRFDVDEGKPGSASTAPLIKRYIGAGVTANERTSFRSAAESDRGEETNKIARRIINSAKGDQTDEDSVNYPIKAYVVTEEGTVFVDVSEAPQA